MILCGLVGPEGVGKTGIVLDSMTDEEKKRGDVIFVLDFDGGGQTTRVTHHREHANNIRCLNPNVMFETFDEDGEIREAIDYPATHRRVMKIGQTLVDCRKPETNRVFILFCLQRLICGTRLQRTVCS